MDFKTAFDNVMSFYAWHKIIQNDQSDGQTDHCMTCAKRSLIYINKRLFLFYLILRKMSTNKRIKQMTVMTSTILPQLYRK